MRRFIGFLLLAGGLLFTIVGISKVISPDVMQTVSISDALSGKLPDDLDFVTIEDGTLYFNDYIEHTKEQKDNPSNTRTVRVLVPLVDDQLAREWDATDRSVEARPDLRGENGKFVLVSFAPDEFLTEFPSIAARNATREDQVYVDRKVYGEVLSKFQIPKDVAEFIRTSFKLAPEQYIYIKQGKDPLSSQENLIATCVFAGATLIGFLLFRKKKPKRYEEPGFSRVDEY
ncbi:MAG: hypothetical protein H6815_05755 [Phycisphaeraceae bacterium]|nr:hypothetical protein [Phycisphaerales bacterium]MCB9859943.1 hypothetical protein [Phycisphaeraceae bacterium]